MNRTGRILEPSTGTCKHLRRELVSPCPLPPQHQGQRRPKIMGLAAPCAIPFQFDVVLGSRLHCKGAEVAKHLQTRGDFLSVRFVCRDRRQSVMPAAMIQRRLPLRRQCHGCLRRERNERERLLPSESWRHNGKVCTGRKKRCRVGPRLNRYFTALGAKRNAKWRSPGFPPANALPEPDRVDHLRLQFIVVMPPQKLKISVVEERASVGGTLAAMDAASAELQAKVAQSALRRLWILRADEYMIEG